MCLTPLRSKRPRAHEADSLYHGTVFSSLSTNSPAYFSREAMSMTFKQPFTLSSSFIGASSIPTDFAANFPISVCTHCKELVLALRRILREENVTSLGAWKKNM